MSRARMSHSSSLIGSPLDAMNDAQGDGRFVSTPDMLRDRSARGEPRADASCAVSAGLGDGSGCEQGCASSEKDCEECDALHPALLPSDTMSGGLGLLSRRWPRHRAIEEGGRWHPRRAAFSFGQEEAEPGVLLGPHVLRLNTGERLEHRVRISLRGDTKVVAVETDVVRMLEQRDPPIVLATAPRVQHSAAGFEGHHGDDDRNREVGGGGDGSDLGHCDSCARNYAWLGDVRQALGVDQFRDTSFGSIEGGRGSGRSGAQAQVVALHDGGIDGYGWDVFVDDTPRILRGFTWGCDDGGAAGWRAETPRIEAEGHATSMAGVMIANGYLDGDLGNAVGGPRHTGMAPQGFVLPLGEDASPSCGSKIWEQKTGPQAAEKAAAEGADLFVSAISRYEQLSDIDPKYGTACGLSAGSSVCNYSSDLRGGSGADYARAIDQAFEDDGLLSVLSAGRYGGHSSTFPICEPGNKFPIGYGRMALTAITVGAVSTQYDCSEQARTVCTPAYAPPMSTMDRVEALQEIGWYGTSLCRNRTGNLPDGRGLPLLLGYSGFCGVPVTHIWCGESAVSEEATGCNSGSTTIVDQSYHNFTGTSAGTAAVAGAILVLKEWLELELARYTIWLRHGGLLRITALNMGDRTGQWCNSLTSKTYATYGLIQHGGFGKLRLRLLDSCHFNDGDLTYATFTMSGGEQHTIEIEDAVASGGGVGLPLDAPLPTDLARLRIAVWLEPPASAYWSTSTLDPALPTGLVSLYREEADGTLTEVAGCAFEDKQSTSTDGWIMGVTGDRGTHASIALDNDWPSASILGGYRYILIVRVNESDGATHDVYRWEYTVHVSVLWETGSDLSLAKNRAGWDCSSPFGVVASQGVVLARNLENLLADHEEQCATCDVDGPPAMSTAGSVGACGR